MHSRGAATIDESLFVFFSRPTDTVQNQRVHVWLLTSVRLSSCSVGMSSGLLVVGCPFSRKTCTILATPSFFSAPSSAGEEAEEETPSPCSPADP